MMSSAQMPSDERTAELDLRNATHLFNVALAKIEAEIGRENLRFPKEIIWLGGAPGAGKGTQTPAIMERRGITAPPIVMSTLLDTPEAKALKDSGNLVGDQEVVCLLLRELLKEPYKQGVVVDGFPRTKVQAGCVKKLYHAMIELRRQFFDTPYGIEFRHPIFRIAVLNVPEEIAVQRQMRRGREAAAAGELVRPTDLDPELARRRCQVFRESTLAALDELRDSFTYHFIDGSADEASVRAAILREFEYQSSLELAPDTVDAFRNIPLSSAVIQYARQNLVRRLDHYRHRQGELFARVIAILERSIVPGLQRHALVGHCALRVEDPVLDLHGAIDMCIDVLAERGYRPTVERVEIAVPIRVDPATQAVVTAMRCIWRFEINFDAARIR